MEWALLHAPPPSYAHVIEVQAQLLLILMKLDVCMHALWPLHFLHEELHVHSVHCSCPLPDASLHYSPIHHHLSKHVYWFNAYKHAQGKLYVISPHRQLFRMVARVYKRERESILSPVSRLSLSSSACANIYNIFVSVEKERESLGMRLEYPSTYTAVQTCCGWLKALCHAIRADCPLMNLHAHM